MTAEEHEVLDLYRQLSDKNQRGILSALRGLVMMQEVDARESALKRASLHIVDGGFKGRESDNCG